MARLSKEEHDKILSSISEASNASPELMELIGRLREDFDESLIVDTRETEEEWNRRYDEIRGERDRAIGERDEARRAYRERFFNAYSEAEKIVAREMKDSPRGMNEVLGITQKDEIN